MTTVYCETTDFIYPLLADVYYPIVEQSAYGNVKKQWILDKTLACNFSSAGTAWKEEVQPNVNITKDVVLIGRTRSDIRISKLDASNAITNVIVTNIRDASGNLVYLETAGVRSGKATIFEIASQEPVVGPFGSIEYHKLIIRRSENQAADI
jgi:hypothetical protein